MFNVTQHQLSPDDTGCEHSNLDGPVVKSDDYEVFQCPKCNNQIARKLDSEGKPVGELFIVMYS